MSDTTRRAMLAGAAGVGVAALVAACSDGDGTGGGGATTPPAGPPATGPVAQTGEIPVGGGKVINDRGIVITQPAAGTFKGFSNICQHLQCNVSNVEGGTINCTCHGSKYAIDTGDVLEGPAPRGLPAKSIKVEGDSITLA